MTEIYPVVHVTSRQQALEQSDLAFDLGADGVYLIDHGNAEEPLVDVFESVKSRHADQFVGVNLLDMHSGADALAYLWQNHTSGRIARLPDGLWVDDAEKDAAYFDKLRQASPELAAIRYLGGVAFKYTPGYTDVPEKAAAAAARMSTHVDVVTTSGKGTGHAPSPHKIAAMKKAIGEQPLAIASGVDSSNIDQYKGLAQQILVASSVETAPYSGVFDADLLAEFIQKAHQD